MDAAVLMSVVDGVVDRFRNSGLPSGVESADLRNEGWMVASSLVGESAEYVAVAVYNRVLYVCRKTRAEEFNAVKFIAEYTADMKHKFYHSPNTQTDHWHLLSLGEMKTYNEEWMAARSEIAVAMEERTRKCRAVLAEMPIGGCYGEVA